MLHVYAAMAEEEARAISLRTKVALAAAKARGVKLGGWRGGAPRDTTAATAGVARKADTFAADVGPMATDMRQRGLSLRQVAAEMTRRGIRTPRGGRVDADGGAQRADAGVRWHVILMTC
jgi:DNA invertase Pin-like site-specific DNA recombinase